ncbi:hypothetical protein N9K77_00355 [bacterium]|nr:hypothetical protein [bacterium]
MFCTEFDFMEINIYEEGMKKKIVVEVNPDERLLTNEEIKLAANPGYFSC